MTSRRTSAPTFNSDIAIAKPIHQSLQGSTLNAFAALDVFDLDDSAFALAYGVNCVDAESAIANQPRYGLLTHCRFPTEP